MDQDGQLRSSSAPAGPQSPWCIRTPRRREAKARAMVVSERLEEHAHRLDTLERAFLEIAAELKGCKDQLMARQGSPPGLGGASPDRHRQREGRGEGRGDGG